MTSRDLQRRRLDGDEVGAVPVTSGDAEQWITLARGGCGNSFVNFGGTMPPILVCVANRELDDDFRGKLGDRTSFKTPLTVQQSFDRFDGTSEVELRRWVRRILLTRLAKNSPDLWPDAKTGHPQGATS